MIQGQALEAEKVVNMIRMIPDLVPIAEREVSLIQMTLQESEKVASLVEVLALLRRNLTALRRTAIFLDLMLTPTEKEAMIQTPLDREAGGRVSLTPTLIHLEDPAAEREASSQEVEELRP